ncbi:hypothetical protein E2C01_048325 [Portunus trituberculatus]|uniref:Uncharacterized protein n=1 Tax=Portunus trituberculatus TaxID=210409 RepID=A0A5B7G2V1_PORTR|nr:hypothetical protein [Portunus trituberculatus]
MARPQGIAQAADEVFVAVSRLFLLCLPSCLPACLPTADCLSFCRLPPACLAGLKPSPRRAPPPAAHRHANSVLCVEGMEGWLVALPAVTTTQAPTPAARSDLSRSNYIIPLAISSSGQTLQRISCASFYNASFEQRVGEALAGQASQRNAKEAQTADDVSLVLGGL